MKTPEEFKLLFSQFHQDTFVGEPDVAAVVRQMLGRLTPAQQRVVKDFAARALAEREPLGPLKGLWRKSAPDLYARNNEAARRFLKLILESPA